MSRFLCALLLFSTTQSFGDNPTVPDVIVSDSDLARFKDQRQLQVLRIKGSEFTDKGLVHLQRLTNLRELYLDETAVTDNGMQYLSELRFLEFISLDNTKITDRAIKHLIKLPRLRELRLKNTFVTYEGLKKLVGLRTLKVLGIAGTRVSLIEIAWLERARPDVRITVYGRNRRLDYGNQLKEVVKLLEKHHISKRRVDDKMSRKWMTVFLNSLDPRRIYLTQSDINQFARFQDRLDDQARLGDTSFPLLVRKIYLQRNRQVTDWAERFLATEHDFTLEEHFRIKRTEFVKDEDALRERWRKLIKYNLLVFKLNDESKEISVRRLQKRYRRFHRRTISDDELMELYLTALTKAFDPHSAYFNPQTLSEFSQ